jgi:predicted acetyltransferase
LLARARDHGLDRVLVTTDPGNEASRKIIERNGGILAEETGPGIGKTKKARYWIEGT